MPNDTPLPTLQDVLEKIEALEEGTKKRDLKSAVNTFCRAVGQHPAAVLAVPKEIRTLRESVSPLAVGLTERRWANVCSGLTKALELVRELVPSRNTTPLHPEWKALLDALPEKLVRKVSAGLRYLSSKGVTPSTVTERSSIASSKADCVRGEARLISSANTTDANTGPGWNSNVRSPS